MGQKINVNGWRRDQPYDSVNKLTDSIYNTGFKFKGDVSIGGWNNYIDANIGYAKSRNIFMIVESMLRDQLFIMDHIFGGINVILSKVGYHVELAVYNPICDVYMDNIKRERRNVFISMVGNLLFNVYGVRTTWSIYDMNSEIDMRVVRHILSKTKYVEAKQSRVSRIKDLYTIKGRCGLIYMTSSGNVTSRIADIIAGLLIRSSGHSSVIKGINKILDKYCMEYNGRGSRDDVQFDRKVFQGISIKIKGTIGGARRTITVDMQRGKMSKSTITAAIVTSYTQAKTTTGTRGVSVTIIY